MCHTNDTACLALVDAVLCHVHAVLCHVRVRFAPHNCSKQQVICQDPQSAAAS